MNNGKGKPIAYDLFPLKRLMKKSGDQEKSVTLFVQSLNKESTHLVQETFEELLRAKRAFHDKLADVNSLEDILDESVVKAFVSHRDKMRDSEVTFKQNLKTKLVEFRSKEASKRSIVLEILEDFRSSLCSEEKVCKFLVETLTPDVQNSINFYGLLRDKGVDYLKRGASLETELSSRSREVYVLFTDPQLADKDFDRYVKEHYLFFKFLARKGKDASVAFLVIDVSIHRKWLEEPGGKEYPCAVRYLDKVQVSFPDDEDEHSSEGSAEATDDEQSRLREELLNAKDPEEAERMIKETLGAEP